jgi:hypothetical protein
MGCGTGAVDLQVPVELTVRWGSLGSSARKSSPTSYQVKLDSRFLLTVVSLENVQCDTVKYKHLYFYIVNFECNDVFQPAIYTVVWIGFLKTNNIAVTLTEIVNLKKNHNLWNFLLPQ